jgi:hypothetical protein
MGERIGRIGQIPTDFFGTLFSKSEQKKQEKSV